MCAEGRPERVGQNERIFTGETLDAYLVREDVGQRGYTHAIWRGRHVADPTELSDDEAAAYFREVLRVGRALERHYRPGSSTSRRWGTRSRICTPTSYRATLTTRAPAFRPRS